MKLDLDGYDKTITEHLFASPVPEEEKAGVFNALFEVYKQTNEFENVKSIKYDGREGNEYIFSITYKKESEWKTRKKE